MRPIGPSPDPTPREIEIWRMVASGRSSRSIAFRLPLGLKTVTNHRERLMVKLKVKNVADLTRAAVAYGIVPVPTLATEGWRPLLGLTVTTNSSIP